MRKSSRKKIQDTKIVWKIDKYIYDSCVDDENQNKTKQKIWKLQKKHFNKILIENDKF